MRVPVAADGAALPSSVDVLILGGGLAGFTFRAGLGGRGNLLLEKAEEIGGLLRMRTRGPYIFDSVPHVIFFRSRRLLAALDRLLDGELHEFGRSNSIWQTGRRIPYPYQFNAAALPVDVRRACLEGFRNNPYRGGGHEPTASFEEWLLAQFGPGFYSHFFRPYNEKLYGLPLDRLEAAPLRWTIPADDAAAVEAGAGDPSAADVVLRYPAGPAGIGRIVSALADLGSGPVITGCAAERIDPVRRVVRTSTGESIRYRTLASSLPLPELLSMLEEVPEEIGRLGRSLSAVSIDVVAIGARRTGDGLPDIWTYFPEPDVPFYRLTRLERISPDLAPRGGASLLLECAGGHAPEPDAILRWLGAHDVVPEDAVEHYETWKIPYAYVLFTRDYRSARERVRSYLADRGIVSFGRYGAWMYADIEMAMKSGLSAARRMRRPDEDPPALERLIDG